MKLTKESLVALFVAIGFNEADNWDHDKMEKYVGLLPTKIKDPNEVPEAHRDLFNKIANSPSDEKIEITGYETKRASAVDKAVDRAAKSKDKENATVTKTKNKAAKAAAKAKPAKKEKKEKKQKPAKPEVPRDAYGSREGSIRATVNATFSKDWKSFEDIVKESGLKERPVRSRLRRACRAGIIEVRKIVEYRLKPAKK